MRGGNVEARGAVQICVQQEVLVASPRESPDCVDVSLVACWEQTGASVLIGFGKQIISTNFEQGAYNNIMSQSARLM